jgi:hypothetical protein
MAITRTATYTATYTRQALIELQISRILGRVGADRATQDAIIKGLHSKWIKELSFYAMNNVNQCRAELFVKIDWGRNSLHVSAGRDTISLDTSWRDGVAVEVEKTLALFLEFKASESLNVSIHTRYAPGVDYAHANRTLGFAPAGPVTWANGSIGTAMTIPELDEFTIGLNFAE